MSDGAVERRATSRREGQVVLERALPGRVEILVHGTRRPLEVKGGESRRLGDVRP